jgi:hypothetical protein
MKNESWKIHSEVNWGLLYVHVGSSRGNYSKRLPKDSVTFRNPLRERMGTLPWGQLEGI